MNMKTKLLFTFLFFFFALQNKNITAQGWSAVGTGMDNADVRALAVHNGQLYAAGIFSTVGGLPIKNIARWTGSAWDSLGLAPYTGSNVLAIASYNNELYAGGTFSIIDGLPMKNIARWN